MNTELKIKYLKVLNEQVNKGVISNKEKKKDIKSMKRLGIKFSLLIFICSMLLSSCSIDQAIVSNKMLNKYKSKYESVNGHKPSDLEIVKAKDRINNMFKTDSIEIDRTVYERPDINSSDSYYLHQYGSIMSNYYYNMSTIHLNQTISRSYRR